MNIQRWQHLRMRYKENELDVITAGVQGGDRMSNIESLREMYSLYGDWQRSFI